MTWLAKLLDGRKTYLSALGFLVLGLVQIFALKDVSGGMQSILAALGAFGLRQAVKKVAATQELVRKELA